VRGSALSRIVCSVCVCAVRAVLCVFRWVGPLRARDPSAFPTHLVDTDPPHQVLSDQGSQCRFS